MLRGGHWPVPCLPLQPLPPRPSTGYTVLLPRYALAEHTFPCCRLQLRVVVSFPTSTSPSSTRSERRRAYLRCALRTSKRNYAPWQCLALRPESHSSAGPTPHLVQLASAKALTRSTASALCGLRCQLCCWFTSPALFCCCRCWFDFVSVCTTMTLTYQLAKQM